MRTVRDSCACGPGVTMFCSVTSPFAVREADGKMIMLSDEQPLDSFIETVGTINSAISCSIRRVRSWRIIDGIDLDDFSHLPIDLGFVDEATDSS